jgi:hypothetical protein
MATPVNTPPFQAPTLPALTDTIPVPPGATITLTNVSGSTVDTVDFGVIPPGASITVPAFNADIAAAIQAGQLKPQASKLPPGMAPAFGYILVTATTADQNVTPTIGFHGVANRNISPQSISLQNVSTGLYKGIGTFPAAPQNATSASLDISCMLDTTGTGKGKVTYQIQLYLLLGVTDVEIAQGRFVYTQSAVFLNRSTGYVSISQPPLSKTADTFQTLAIALGSPVTVSIYGEGSTDPSLPTDATAEIKASYDSPSHTWTGQPWKITFSYPAHASQRCYPCPQDAPPFDNTLVLADINSINPPDGFIIDENGNQVNGTFHNLPPLQFNVGSPPAGQFWDHLVNLQSDNGVLSANIASNAGVIGPKATFDFSNTTFTSPDLMSTMKIMGSTAVPGTGTNAFPPDSQNSVFVPQ